jgi:hypothetical protein
MYGREEKHQLISRKPGNIKDTIKMPPRKRVQAPTHSEVTIVYPHQLFQESPALSHDRLVVLAEDPWFFRRHRFHAQKLVLHRTDGRYTRIPFAAERRTIPKSLTKCPQKQQRERYP